VAVVTLLVLAKTGLSPAGLLPRNTASSKEAGCAGAELLSAMAAGFLPGRGLGLGGMIASGPITGVRAY
jgi:hypothetical protein